MIVELAAPLIDWSGLGEVALFAVVAGLVIVGAFSLGVAGLDGWDRSRHGAEPETEPPGAAPVPISDAATPVAVSRPTVGFGALAMAIVGFGVCVIAVLLGIWSIVYR